MNTANDLMLGYIRGTAEQSSSLFADNGTLELPYLASIGLPPVMTGPRAITEFLGFLHGTLYPGFRFEDVKYPHRDSAAGVRRISHQPPVRVFRAKTSSSNSSVTWKPPTARSSGSGRRSMSSSQRRRSTERPPRRHQRQIVGPKALHSHGLVRRCFTRRRDDLRQRPVRVAAAKFFAETSHFRSIARHDQFCCRDDDIVARFGPGTADLDRLWRLHSSKGRPRGPRVRGPSIRSGPTRIRDRRRMSAVRS